MLKDIPTWFRVWFVFCLVVGIVTTVYTFKECGSKAFLLGTGGFYAAVTGMCDKN